jgi:hypothetical protein
MLNFLIVCLVFLIILGIAPVTIFWFLGGEMFTLYVILKFIVPIVIIIAISYLYWRKISILKQKTKIMFYIVGFFSLLSILINSMQFLTRPSISPPEVNRLKQLSNLTINNEIYKYTIEKTNGCYFLKISPRINNSIEETTSLAINKAPTEIDTYINKNVIIEGEILEKSTNILCDGNNNSSYSKHDALISVSIKSIH